MLSLSWAVAPASNSQYFELADVKLTTSYCVSWLLWLIQGMGQSSVYGSIFVLLPKMSVMY
jgi:hypothetical protein